MPASSMYNIQVAPVQPGYLYNHLDGLMSLVFAQIRVPIEQLLAIYAGGRSIRLDECVVDVGVRHER